MATKMPTIHTFMTKQDEDSFSKLIVEQVPDVKFIDMFIWPTSTPVTRNSIAGCSSSMVAILKTGITSMDFYSKTWVGRRTESNGYDGAQIGPGIIQFLRSKPAHYDPKSLRNGRLSATYNPDTEHDMDASCESGVRLSRRGGNAPSCRRPAFR